jgi:Leucine-rich repeat (LRR) protein
MNHNWTRPRFAAASVGCSASRTGASFVHWTVNRNDGKSRMISSFRCSTPSLHGGPFRSGDAHGPFLPWAAAAAMALIAVGVSLRPKDPIVELTNFGWQVTPMRNGEIEFTFTGHPRGPSRPILSALRRLRHEPIIVTIVSDIKTISGIEAFRELKSFSSHDLMDTRVTDLSPLRELKNLSSLYLNGTKVTDLSPVRELKSLSLLDLSGTKVIERQTFDLLKQSGVQMY